jgi:hypothetical protein
MLSGSPESDERAKEIQFAIRRAAYHIPNPPGHSAGALFLWLTQQN